MSILGMYTDWYEPADLIDEDDGHPTWPTEALTSANGVVWWSAAAVTEDEE